MDLRPAAGLRCDRMTKHRKRPHRRAVDAPDAESASGSSERVRIAVWTSIIGLLSAIAVAVVYNWEKFASRETPEKAVVAAADGATTAQPQPSPTTPSTTHQQPVMAQKSKRNNGDSGTPPSTQTATTANLQSQASTPAEQELPKVVLKAATVKFKTGRHSSKHPATAITLRIASSRVGQLAYKETAGKEYKGSSNESVELDVLNDVVKDDSAAYSLLLSVTNPLRTWKFKAYAELVWSDGTYTKLRFGEMTLNKSEPTAEAQGIVDQTLQL